MFIKKIFPFGLLILLVLATGCGASKKANVGKIDRNSPAFLMKTMIANQVNVQWLSARAKIDFSDENLSMGATATIRIRRDSLIWASVRKLGFEVARAQITKDSVYIVDRINDTYEVKDLAYLAKEYNVPADFDAIQAIFLGNPIFFTTNDLQAETLPDALHLFGKSSNTATHYWLDPKSLQLNQMRFEDINDKRIVQVKLEDYQPLQNNQKFSYLRKLEMNSQETGNIKVEMQFSQLEINSPKDVRFEIPQKYTRGSNND